MWASLKPRRCRVLAHARRLGRQRVCGAAFGRTRDQVWQEPATTRRKDRKLDPTPIGGPPRVVGMRWNQPWNFSRLLKHLTEHRMMCNLAASVAVGSGTIHIVISVSPHNPDAGRTGRAGGAPGRRRPSVSMHGIRHGSTGLSGLRLSLAEATVTCRSLQDTFPSRPH